MKALDLKKENRPPSILIYGPAGTGKTALVSQLSKGYMFDFDRGMRTALTLEDKFTSLRQQIEFDIFVDDNPRKPNSYMNAKKALYDLTTRELKKELSYNAIIVDSLTGLCRSAQLFVQSQGDKSNPTRDPLAKMEIQNWGSLVAEVERFLTILRSFGVLTCVTAHTDQVTDEDGVVTNIFPMSATKSHGLNKLLWLFDEVWYASTSLAGQGKLNYRITGITQGKEKTRTRSSITTITHNDLGIEGLLNKTGYKYGNNLSK